MRTFTVCAASFLHVGNYESAGSNFPHADLWLVIMANTKPDFMIDKKESFRRSKTVKALH